VTLPPSKTPCLDALAFCVVMKLGADMTEEDKEHHTITIFDCDLLLGYIKHFCPKQNQTSNNEARIKALKRWFNNIPAKKRRSEVFKIEMKVRCLLFFFSRLPETSRSRQKRLM
jgi:hypothetical protein